MKITFTLPLFFFLSLGLSGQDYFQESFNQFEQVTCPFNPVETISLPKDWSIYQTLNDEWDGPVDSTRCIGLKGNHAIDLEEIDPAKALFMKYEGPPVFLDPDKVVFAEVFHPVSGGLSFKDGIDCPGGLCSGLIIGIDIPAETGGGRATRIHKKGRSAGNHFYVTDCIPTEYFETNFLREIVMKFTFEVFDADQDIRPDFTYLSQYEEAVKIYELPFPESTFDGESYNAGFYQLGPFSQIYLMMHTPGVYPNPENPTYVEAFPVPNITEAAELNLFVENYENVFFQPYTFLRGGLVDGSDTLRHQLNFINDGGDFCISSVADIIFSGDVHFIQRSGQVDFGGKASCLMFEKGASLEVADGATFHYGENGEGALALGRGGTIKLGKESKLVINNQFVLWDFRRHPDNQVYIDLPRGAALVFGENAILRKIGYQSDGYMKLNVYMNGGILDDSRLSPAERSLINRIYPTPEAQLLDNIKIYGNPAGDQLTFSLALAEETALQWQISRLDGQRVLHGEAPAGKGISFHETAVDNLSAGMYLLEVRTRNARAVKQFVKF